jgi:hypothetical protein
VTNLFFHTFLALAWGLITLTFLFRLRFGLLSRRRAHRLLVRCVRITHRNCPAGCRGRWTAGFALWNGATMEVYKYRSLSFRPRYSIEAAELESPLAGGIYPMSSALRQWFGERCALIACSSNSGPIDLAVSDLEVYHDWGGLSPHQVREART